MIRCEVLGGVVTASFSVSGKGKGNCCISEAYTLIALCSIALGKPVVSNLAILGDITISGTMIKVDELANTLQVCLDSGAKKVLIPSTSFVDFSSVPADLMSAFQLIPYQSAEGAVFKALGVE